MSKGGELKISDQWLCAALDEVLGEPLTEDKLAGLDRLEWSEYRAEAGSPYGPIEGLAGLERCTNLRVLELDGNAVQDLTPLTGLSCLEELWLLDNAVKDLTPLRDLENLRILIVAGCFALADLSPIAGLFKLEKLDCSATSVSDLSPLAELRNLKTLSLNGLNIELAPGSLNREVVVELMARGVKVQIPESGELLAEARSSSAEAVAEGNTRTLEGLLQRLGALRLLGMLRADGIEARNDEQHSLLHLLVKPPYDEENPVTGEERLELVRALVVEGLAVDVTESSGVTPLNYMLDFPEKLDVGLVRLLLQLGADPNRLPDYSPPAVAQAVKVLNSEVEGAAEVLELLLDHGVKLAAPENFVALCDAGNVDIVRRALSVGADPNAPDSRLLIPPLHAAVRSGAFDIVELLLENGANANASDGYGETALHEARTPEVARLLLDNGADVNAHNEYGVSPLDRAVTPELEQFLKEHGGLVGAKK